VLLLVELSNDVMKSLLGSHAANAYSLAQAHGVIPSLAYVTGITVRFYSARLMWQYLLVRGSKGMLGQFAGRDVMCPFFG
jgi:hypothetical protein